MRKNKNSLLAIDPGTREFGFASFEDGELTDFGVKSIKQGTDVKDMLQDLDKRITRLLNEKRPFEVAIETNHYTQISGNIRLAMATAVIKGLSTKRGIRCFELDPRTIRKIVCKDGNATKAETARTVGVFYPELRVYVDSDKIWKTRHFRNITDAVAVGMAFTKQSQTFSLNRGK